MDTSLFAFATDLEDEGVDAVLENVAARASLGGLTVAAAYHHGRDIFPHNPVRKVRFLEGGTVFFRPDATRYHGLRLQPVVSRLAAEADPLPRVISAAAARSLRVRAWTVFLHNYTLGEASPDCACRNAFGDAHLTDLCPANLEVRAYAVALTADLAARGVAAVVAESLHYHGLEHGFHHERYFIELGALGRFLLGLCFCDHCLAAAARSGVDGRALRDEARRELERRFAAPPGPEATELARDEVGGFAGGELRGYLDARSATVTSLVAEVAAAAAGNGSRLAFIDLCGAVKGYATGRPGGAPVPEIGWQFGIDAAAIARECQLEVIGYAADPERLALDLGAYRSLAPGADLSVILRPMPPDCESAENLAEKLLLIRRLGFVETGFYHYGFMRLESLDLVRRAMSG